jgi:hypothetical protein
VSDSADDTTDSTDTTTDESADTTDSTARQPEDRLIPPEEISEDGQVYVDRDTIDFDPAEGMYSGTAVDGSTDIPGPHEGETPQRP